MQGNRYWENRYAARSEMSSGGEHNESDNAFSSIREDGRVFINVMISYYARNASL
jgi:hypothetical protein